MTKAAEKVVNVGASIVSGTADVLTGRKPKGTQDPKKVVNAQGQLESVTGDIGVDAYAPGEMSAAQSAELAAQRRRRAALPFIQGWPGSILGDEAGGNKLGG